MGSENKLQRWKKGSWSLGTGSPHPEGFYLEVSGEDPNRIFISFPGVSPQGHGRHQGVISQMHLVSHGIATMAPDVSNGIASPGFAAFPGLEVKHSWSLDVISLNS